MKVSLTPGPYTKIAKAGAQSLKIRLKLSVKRTVDAFKTLRIHYRIVTLNGYSDVKVVDVDVSDCQLNQECQKTVDIELPVQGSNTIEASDYRKDTTIHANEIALIPSGVTVSWGDTVFEPAIDGDVYVQAHTDLTASQAVDVYKVSGSYGYATNILFEALDGNGNIIDSASASGVKYDNRATDVKLSAGEVGGVAE